MSNILKKFNCPGRFFDVVGYLTVIIGLIIVVIGIVGWITYPDPFTMETEPALYLSQYIALIPLGFIVAIICPQLFFAIAKIVKAAEKYLSK